MIINKYLKSTSLLTLMAFGIVGCSGGADLTEDSNSFQSPTGRTIANNDSPSTGGSARAPSSSGTTSPVSAAPQNSGNEDTPAEASESEGEATNQDILDALAAQGDALSSEIDAAENAANSAKSRSNTAAWLAGGALAAGLGSLFYNMWSHNKQTEHMDEMENRLGQATLDEGDRTREAVAGEGALTREEIEAAHTALAARLDRDFTAMKNQLDRQTAALAALQGSLAALAEKVNKLPDDTRAALLAEFEALQRQGKSETEALMGAINTSGKEVIATFQTELDALANLNRELAAAQASREQLEALRADITAANLPGQSERITTIESQMESLDGRVQRIEEMLSEVLAALKAPNEDSAEPEVAGGNGTEEAGEPEAETAAGTEEATASSEGAEESGKADAGAAESDAEPQADSQNSLSVLLAALASDDPGAAAIVDWFIANFTNFDGEALPAAAETEAPAEAIASGDELRDLRPNISLPSAGFSGAEAR